MCKSRFAPAGCCIAVRCHIHKRMSGLRGLVNVSVGGVRLAPDASARRSSWYRATSQDTARPSTLDHEPRSDITPRSEEHTSELQSLMSISYAAFCLRAKTLKQNTNEHTTKIRLLSN